MENDCANVSGSMPQENKAAALGRYKAALLQAIQKQHLQDEDRIETHLRQQERQIEGVLQRVLGTSSLPLQPQFEGQDFPPVTTSSKELKTKISDDLTSHKDPAVRSDEADLVEVMWDQHLLHEMRVEALLTSHEHRVHVVAQRMLGAREGKQPIALIANAKAEVDGVDTLSDGRGQANSRTVNFGDDLEEQTSFDHINTARNAKNTTHSQGSVHALDDLKGEMEALRHDSLQFDSRLSFAQDRPSQRPQQTITSAGELVDAPMSSQQFTFTESELRRHGWFRRTAIQILAWKYCDFLVALCICVNGVVIGAQTDWIMRNLHESTPEEYRVLDLFFTIFFALELVLRLVAEHTAFFKCSNKNMAWNVFDTLIIVSAVLEEIMQALSSDMLTMQAMRSIRVLKLIRIIRVVRLLRFFHDLRTMVYGILYTMKSLMWALILLVLVMYMFSVCLMQIMTGFLEEAALSEAELDEDAVLTHFGSLGLSLYTLHKALFGGMDWGEAADPMTTVIKSPFMLSIFLIYVTFCFLCVLNIVTGVFVENANKITMKDEDFMIMEELSNRKTWFEEVRYLFKTADQDDSGAVTLEEFMEVCEDIRVKALMRKMGIDVVSSKVRGLFSLLDFNGDGTVDIDEFVLGVQQIHGNAKSLDMVKLRYQTKQMFQDVEYLQNYVKEQFQEQHDSIAYLEGQRR